MTKKKKVAEEKPVPELVSDHGDVGRFALVKGGHEDGTVCLTVGVTVSGDILIADGRRRRLARPKLKGSCHVRLLDKSAEAVMLMREGKLTDRQIRRILFHRRDYSAKG